VGGVTMLWNFSTFGLDDPDLEPPISRPPSQSESAHQLISRTDREFVVFARSREEKVIFIRYPADIGSTADEVKISFMKPGKSKAKTKSSPNIDNNVERKFDRYVARIMAVNGG
jgi:hypothetical protein